MNWSRRQRKLTYIIFAQTCELSWARPFLLESSSISLFPDVSVRRLWFLSTFLLHLRQ
jgi:hypothetical protein